MDKFFVWAAVIVTGLSAKSAESRRDEGQNQGHQVC